MVEYFKELKEYLSKKYTINNYSEKICVNSIDNILGFSINEDVKNIYNRYERFNISWFDNEKYMGEIFFVPFENIQQEHDELVEIMEECYDVECDEYGIVQDINNWYPLFQFRNGDAFCLDKRNGSVVLYQHEVYEMGIELHGLLISKSVDELFYKWSCLHFANVYYWDEICDDDGINLESKLAKMYV